MQVRRFLCAHMHVFPSCACLCTQIFTKIFVVVHYSVMSFSLKFHKDPTSVAEIFAKLSDAFFLAV